MTTLQYLLKLHTRMKSTKMLALGPPLQRSKRRIVTCQCTTIHAYRMKSYQETKVSAREFLKWRLATAADWATGDEGWKRGYKGRILRQTERIFACYDSKIRRKYVIDVPFFVKILDQEVMFFNVWTNVGLVLVFRLLTYRRFWKCIPYIWIYITIKMTFKKPDSILSA